LCSTKEEIGTCLKNSRRITEAINALAAMTSAETAGKTAVPESGAAKRTKAA
jgi:hypothetical protein